MSVTHCCILWQSCRALHPSSLSAKTKSYVLFKPCLFSPPSSDCPVQGQCPAALCRAWGQGFGSELPLSKVLWLCRLQNLAPARKKSNNFFLVLQADSSQVPEDDVSAQSWWGRAGHQKSQLFPTLKFSSSLKTERRTKLLKELNVLSNLQLI